MVFSFLQASTKQATILLDVANPTDCRLDSSMAARCGRSRRYCTRASAIIAAACLVQNSLRPGSIRPGSIPSARHPPGGMKSVSVPPSEICD